MASRLIRHHPFLVRESQAPPGPGPTASPHHEDGTIFVLRGLSLALATARGNRALGATSPAGALGQVAAIPPGFAGRPVRLVSRPDHLSQDRVERAAG